MKHSNLILFIILIIVITLQYYKYKETYIDYMIIPNLKAGLGNQLFELATAYSLSKELNKTLQLHAGHIELSSHSPINYMDTIFVNFKSYFTTDSPSTQIKPNITASDYTALKEDKTPAELVMFNQDWKKIHPHRAEFVNQLNFNTSIISKYPQLDSSAFIRFRGGDYKGLPFLQVPLNSYYTTALERLKSHSINHIYVFTNDREYALSFDVLNTINHTFVDENEYDSLYLMSRCAHGGICPNSTFSWWGLYLNIDRRHLIMPNTWIVDAHRPHGFYPDFHFPEATVIDNN